MKHVGTDTELSGRNQGMIREIHDKDIEECVDVIRKSFATVANEFGLTMDNASRFTAFATTKERLEYHLNEEHRPMYAFCDDDKVIGYYSLLLMENTECELNNLCVLPEYRHNGIGEKLLQSAFDNAKNLGCKKMHIGIVEENKVLRDWYEKFGFVHIKKEKYDFFPFTCGYMEKTLQDEINSMKNVVNNI